MKHLRKPKNSDLSLLLTAILLGLLISFQAKSFQNLGDVINRDNRADVFREIQILKETNDSLEDEIVDLGKQLDKASNNQDALQSVKDEIQKYQLIAGRADVSGPGVNVVIDGNVKALWLTDIVNELFSAGAEAVSVNSIRLTNSTTGFDTIPNGQIMLNSVILNVPYKIEAIGDRKVLNQALSQTDGIIERMKKILDGGVQINIEEKDLVVMKKVI